LIDRQTPSFLAVVAPPKYGSGFSAAPKHWTPRY
jgi:hypothetical protein